MSGDIKELNNDILHITQSVVVHTPKYSKFGGYEGENDIYTMDIAKGLYLGGWRKQSEGEWIICSDGYYPYCSNCKEEPKNGVMTDYCPNCGAYMKGGEE